MRKNVTTTDSYGTTYEVFTGDLKWRPSAYGIVLKGENVLLSPQFDKNRFDLPGGAIELGELPEIAVIREVKEETGLDVANPKLIAAASNFFTFHYEDENRNDHVQSILLYYICELRSGELSTASFDEYEKEYVRMAEWFPIAELDSVKVASSYDWRETVKKAAKQYAHSGH